MPESAVQLGRGFSQLCLMFFSAVLPAFPTNQSHPQGPPRLPVLFWPRAQAQVSISTCGVLYFSLLRTQHPQSESQAQWWLLLRVCPSPLLPGSGSQHTGCPRVFIQALRGWDPNQGHAVYVSQGTEALGSKKESSLDKNRSRAVCLCRSRYACLEGHTAT